MHKLTGAAKSVFTSIYTEVRMDAKKGQEAWNSSIIDFYNNVFLDRMKIYLVNLDSKKGKLNITKP